MAKKISSHKLLVSLAIAFWIVITVCLLDLLKIPIYWPAFTVLNLLTIIGFTKQNIIKIFVSCVAGIGIALLYLNVCTLLTPFLGETATIGIILFIFLAAILVFDEVASICLNTHTIIVFTYCLVSVHEFAATWPQVLMSTFIGGGVALAGILGIIKLAAKSAKEQ